MIYGIIGVVAVVIGLISVLRIVEKKKLIADINRLVREVKSLLGKFIEESIEKKYIRKSILFKEKVIRKNLLDEAADFIVFAHNLPEVIYSNNLKTLEQMMVDYLTVYKERIGDGKKFISSLDMVLYEKQFLEEGKRFAARSGRYIADSEIIQYFMSIFSNPKQYLMLLNEKYMNEERNECAYLFDNIDGKSLDLNQRNAVVNDDFRQLVIAGAGSGKTLTVAAKVKYLVERRGINPKDILLISFTNKSAIEMGERIRKLGIDMESLTFHKYGMRIMRNVNKKTKDVAEDIGEYIDKYLQSVVFNDADLAKDFLYILGVLMLPVFDDEKIGERIEVEQRQDLTTIRGMYEANANKTKTKMLEQKIESFEKKLRPLHDKLSHMSDNDEGENVAEVQKTVHWLEQEIYELRSKMRSIKNEKLKSAEEVMLANIFFLDGVEYEYEREYPYDEADNYRKKYRPDFYLTESAVYWEHFGIDEQGRARQYDEVTERKYLEGIAWKRRLHKKNNTKLAETYSWQCGKNVIVKAIDNNYKKFGVQKHEVQYCDIIREIMKGDAAGNIESFKLLLASFVSLFKSYGYSIDKFDELRKLIVENKEDTLSGAALERRRDRDLMFLEFAEKFYAFYTETLIEEEKIDFNDMIIQAAELIEQGAYIPLYKYIIIDEYQDISVGRYRLAKATLEKCNAKLFCVGDDWQSIYRFSGSEVDLLVRFEKYFGLYSRNDIVKTYRNSQELLDVSGAFIMANEYQNPKQLKSNKHLYSPVRLVWYSGSSQPILEDASVESEISLGQAFREAVRHILKEFPDGEILLLGRNNSDINFLSEDTGIRVRKEEGEIRVILDTYPNVKMRFLTVHRSKGLEADNVILLNARNARSGFPNQIVDDPLLNLLRDTEETFPFAEERRLFYVALTRTKHYTYILSPITNYSCFLDDIIRLKENGGRGEIINIYPNRENEDKMDKAIDRQKTNTLSCPICKRGTLVKRRGMEGRLFVSCSNRPSCTYMTNNLDAVRKNNRCPVCDNFLVKRKGINGEFWGCMSYPYCTYTANIIADKFNYTPFLGNGHGARTVK